MNLELQFEKDNKLSAAIRLYLMDKLKDKLEITELQIKDALRKYY
jgi:hypothetical protein